MLALLHNKTAQSISGWIGIWSLIFGGLAKMTPEWVGHLTWPQAILTGIAGMLVASLVLALVLLVGAFAFRTLKPHRDSELTGPANAVEKFAYDDSSLRIQLAELQATQRAIIDDYQRMCGMEARYDESHERLKQALFPLVGVPEKLEAVGADGAIAASDLEKLTLTVKDHRERAKSAFNALRVHEALPALEAEVEAIYSKLTERLLDGEEYDAAMWKTWEVCYSAWASKLDEWLALGTWYAHHVKERVKTIDDHKYDAPLSIPDAHFPNADAVRRFKKFAIINDQWQAIIPEVRNGVYQVAFGGLSESEVRHGTLAG